MQSGAWEPRKGNKLARAIDRGARAQINRHVKTMAATAAGAIVQPPAAYRQNQLIYTAEPRDLHTFAVEII